MNKLMYFANTLNVVIVSGLRELIPASFRNFPGPFHPDSKVFAWVVPAALSPVKKWDHFVRTITCPDSTNPSAFHRIIAGRRSKTSNAQALKNAHSLALYDLRNACRALQNVMNRVGDGRHQQFQRYHWQDRLAVLEAEKHRPEEPLTLLRLAPQLAAERGRQMSRIGKTVEEKIASLEFNNDIEQLTAMIDGFSHLVNCLCKARMANEKLASGLRAIARQIFKNRRPLDETILRQILGSAKLQAQNCVLLQDMARISAASGISCSEIWPQFHGDPDKFDFWRFFQLCILAGQLERGKSVYLEPDIALYLVRELCQESGGSQAEHYLAYHHPAFTNLRDAFDGSIGFIDLLHIARLTVAKQCSSLLDPSPQRFRPKRQAVRVGNLLIM